jgi:hypothetical protein
MTPPILRLAMARVEQTADEEVLETAQQAWTTTDRTPV